MRAYKYNKRTYKVETKNALIVIEDNLTDMKGRNVTSVQIIPDSYAGENKCIRVGGSANVRVITLKKKNR
jgi:hypothetical protein